MSMAIILVAALALAFALLPLMRTAPPSADRRDLDLEFYRRQLAELDDEVERGALSADQAGATRLELERRLLKAGERKTQESPGANSATAAMFAAGIIFAGACGLYFAYGSPGVPSQAKADASTARPGAAALPRLPEGTEDDMDDLLAQLAERLANSPEDAQGWTVYGRSLSTLGRHAEAVNAYTEALRHLPENADLWVAQGQALVLVGEGRVVPAARHAFGEAQQIAPNHPASKHYLALAKYQDRDFRGAYTDWRALLASAPADAPWREPVAAGLRLAADALGEPMPSQQAVEQAGQMSDEERDAFIESMVERLAARLEDEPENREGWLRLAQAYRVLGRNADAVQAYTIARDLSEAEEKARIQLEIDALSGN